MKKLNFFLPLSDSSASRTEYTAASGFTAVSFLYFFTLLLYIWSTPAWFSRFPRASAFRFILAIGVYCLCCMLFSGLMFASIVSGRTVVPFVRIFLLSFLPVVIFSILVLAGGGLSLQHLQLVVRISDIYACAGSLAGIYTAEKRLPPEQAAACPLSMFFLYSMVQTVAAMISLLPYIHGFITTVCRIVVLFVFVFCEIFRQPFYSVRDKDTASIKKDEDISTVAAQYRLSPRETEVFELVCHGRTNEEIAAELFISLSTVKTHLSSIFLKTGVRNRLEAAALCRYFMPEKLKIILPADTGKAVHSVVLIPMGTLMKKYLWKVLLFSGMFLIATGSVCVSCVSAPDAGYAKHDISVNASKDLNGDIFTCSVFSNIRNVLLVDEKDRSKKIELSANDWSYNQDTTRIIINRPVPFSSYIVAIRGEAAFPYSYVLNGIINLKNMYVILNDRLAIDGYDYTFDSRTNRLTFRSDINISDCKWYITYDMKDSSVALGDGYSGDKESDRLGYFEAQHRKEYLDSWYDSQNSFWFFSDYSPEGQKPALVKRAATPAELQAMKSYPVSVMKIRMKTSVKKLSHELGYKISFPRTITLPEYNAQYTTDFQTIEEYSEAGKLVKKIYVFYELTSELDSSLPPQLGLYILPPDMTARTDANESIQMISSDTVDLGIPVSRLRSWALFSDSGNDPSDKPAVISETQWSWHTPYAEYMLESDSTYEPVCGAFIREWVK